MKYLVVYAHPDPDSFNHAVLETVEKELKSAGADYKVRDLYAEPFDPALRRAEMENLKNHTISKDISAEQKLVAEADVLIFIHPVWWFSMPAVLKGYIDRVLSEGFAFQVEETGVSGKLKGKKIVSFNTTGGTERTYKNAGYSSCFEKCIGEGIFGFCGMEVLSQHFLYAVESVSRKERQDMLEKVADLMRTIVIKA